MVLQKDMRIEFSERKIIIKPFLCSSYFIKNRYLGKVNHFVNIELKLLKLHFLIKTLKQLIEGIDKNKK